MFSPIFLNTFIGQMRIFENILGVTSKSNYL
jgi:hypothetical protein